MKKTVITLLIALSFGFAFPTDVFAETWFPVRSTANWYTFASDSDGSNLIAGVTGGRLYTSDDGGSTWTERRPNGSDSNYGWRGVASDADGSNLIALDTSGFGYVYTSDDFGVTWEGHYLFFGVPVGFRPVASDADGSTLIAAAEDDRLYISNDSGETWEERQPAGNLDQKWVSVASDADGSHLVAAVYNGRLYTSDDYGVTWDERRPSGLDQSFSWQSVDSDDDGSHLIAAVGGAGGRLYTSDDFGVTWDERQPAGDANKVWIGVASDDDGSHIVAAVIGGRVYVSDDGGVSWDEERPVGDTNQNWRPVASDADGSDIFVGVYGGSVYRGRNYPYIPEFSSSYASPFDGEEEVLVDATFTLVLSEDVATSTGNITIKKSSDDSTVETIDITGPKVTLSDTDTLTFDPATTLDQGTGYYILIDSGAIENLSGGVFPGISATTTWNFTTDAVPEISELYPEDDSTGVDDAVQPVVSFGSGYQEMTVATGNITIKKTSDDSIVEVLDVTDINEVEASGEAVYLYPDTVLDQETGYYILIDSGALEDGQGNVYGGISDKTVWNFTTEAGPSVVVDETFVTGSGFDSAVYALAVDDGKILAGGSFGSYDSDSVGYGIARLNTDGSLDETFVTGDGFTSTVYALTVDDEGKILVGGYFIRYDGETAYAIARLNTDGSLDETFVTGDGFYYEDWEETFPVYSIAIQDDGKILVGGNFLTYDGDTAYSIARLNTDGSLDETFVTGTGLYDDDEGDTGTVYSLAIQDDGKILVGGSFYTYDGDTAYSIVRLNNDGSLDETFVTGMGLYYEDWEETGTIRSLAIQDDGKIIVGGVFYTYDGDTAYSIVRLNADGSLDETFITGTGFYDEDEGLGSVSSLAIDDDGKILAGGSFGSYDSDSVGYGIARLNTDGSLDETFVTGDGFVGGPVNAVVLDSDTTAVVGGDFSSYDGEDVGYIVRLTLPVEEGEDPPPAGDDDDDDDDDGSGGGGSSRHRSVAPAPTVPATQEELVKSILEQLILVLQQLIQALLAQQQQQ